MMTTPKLQRFTVTFRALGSVARGDDEWNPTYFADAAVVRKIADDFATAGDTAIGVYEVFESDGRTPRVLAFRFADILRID